MFMSALHTESTKHQYLYLLDKYLRYSGKSTYDELIQDDPKNIQKDLEDYLLELKEASSLSAITVQFYALFLFFSMNDVILNTAKIRKMFPPQDETVGGGAYSKKDIKTILESIPTPRRQNMEKEMRNTAFVYFMSASGCRVGGAVSVTWMNVRPIENCSIVTVHAGTSSEYTTFLTPQATKALNQYRNFLFVKIAEEKKEAQFDKNKKVREIYHDTPIFGKDVDTSADFYANEDAVRRTMERILARAGVVNKTSKGTFTIPVLHGFRKYFNTQLKSNPNINPLFVERMMGHNIFKLDKTYLKPPVEVLFAEYKKGIMDLEICP
jgi:integrase